MTRGPRSALLAPSSVRLLGPQAGQAVTRGPLGALLAPSSVRLLGPQAGQAVTRGPLGALLVAFVGVLGIGCREPSRDPPHTAEQPETSAGRQTRRATRLDLLQRIHRCDIEHRGWFFDLGTPATEGLTSYLLERDGGTSSLERDGATWLRVGRREISVRFVVEEPTRVFVGARVRGGVAKSAAAFIDGKAVGQLAFGRGAARVVSTPQTTAALAVGTHTLTLRFPSAPRDTVEPIADVDWVRVGVADDQGGTFAAPTLIDAVTNVALSKVPHRALALRAPSAVRCTLGVPAERRLRVSIGLEGVGEGDAEVRFVEEGKPPEVLRSVKVIGGETAAWTEVEAPMAAMAGKIGTIELVARGTSRGARLLFGDPALLGPEEDVSRVPHARAVVIVVVSALDPARVPPWGTDIPLPAFAQLAREATVFDLHRAPTSVTNGVVASMLTGLSPAVHGVSDGFSKLPEGLPTLGTVAREASVRTAMFTSNPLSGDAFGFARGWDRFTIHSPIAPALGTAPIDDVAAWIAERDQSREKGMLVVAHVRGLHPPYDMPPGEFAQLPSPQYTGPIDPRRAGQVLAKLRVERKRGQRYSDGDRQKLEGLIGHALVATDRAIGSLIEALRKRDLWDDTLLVVTGDLATAWDLSEPPFAEGSALSEDLLHVPLYVRFPRGALAGRRVESATTFADIARTSLAALGIEPAAGMGGEELFTLASRGARPVERSLVATLGEGYASRWGPIRLAGKSGQVPSLCLLDVDPRCESDARDRYPLLMQEAFRRVYDAEVPSVGVTRVKREPLTIDPDTAAMLGVWGR